MEQSGPGESAHEIDHRNTDAECADDPLEHDEHRFAAAVEKAHKAEENGGE